MLGKEELHLLEESVRWGAMLAVANFALYGLLRIMPSLNVDLGRFAAKIILLFVLVGVVYRALQSVAARGIPMNKFVMTLGIIFLAELLIFLFYRMVGNAGQIRSGLLPLPVAMVVALLTKVQSLPLVERA